MTTDHANDIKKVFKCWGREEGNRYIYSKYRNLEEKGQIDVDSMNKGLLNNLIPNRKWNLYFRVKHTLEMLRKALDYLYVIAKERERK